MQQASYLKAGPLTWILPLHLHLNKKSDDDYEDDFNISSHICGYDNFSSKFYFQGPELKVKVDMTEIFSVI